MFDVVVKFSPYITAYFFNYVQTAIAVVLVIRASPKTVEISMEDILTVSG